MVKINELKNVYKKKTKWWLKQCVHDSPKTKDDLMHVQNKTS